MAVEAVGALSIILYALTTVEPPDVDSAFNTTEFEPSCVAVNDSMSVPFVETFGPCDTNTPVPSVKTVSSQTNFSSAPFCPDTT